MPSLTLTNGTIDPFQYPHWPWPMPPLTLFNTPIGFCNTPIENVQRPDWNFTLKPNWIRPQSDWIRPKRRARRRVSTVRSERDRPTQTRKSRPQDARTRWVPTPEQTQRPWSLSMRSSMWITLTCQGSLRYKYLWYWDMAKKLWSTSLPSKLFKSLRRWTATSAFPSNWVVDVDGDSSPLLFIGAKRWGPTLETMIDLKKSGNLYFGDKWRISLQANTHNVKGNDRHGHKEGYIHHVVSLPWSLKA